MISCEINILSSFCVCVILKYTYLISSEPISVGYERTDYSTTEMEGGVELCAIILQPEEGIALREFSLAVVISSTGNFTQGNLLYTPTVVTLKVYLFEESMIKIQCSIIPNLHYHSYLSRNSNI